MIAGQIGSDDIERIEQAMEDCERINPIGW
jgi:hypothetical protein